MQFGFSKQYRFDCVRCGACCQVRKLGLTDVEYERFTKEVSNSHYTLVDEYSITPTITLHDISFKEKDCCYLQRTNRKTVCKIYDKRFIMCRLFPLYITALPDGELFINIIHCNGVCLGHGEVVDESFVKTALDNVKAADSYFIDEFIAEQQSIHQGLFSLYTPSELVEFWPKRFLQKKIAQWFVTKSPSNASIDIRLSSLEEALSRELTARLQSVFNESGLSTPPIILTDRDVKRLANDVEGGLKKQVYKIAEEKQRWKENEIKQIMMTNKANIEVDGESKKYGLNESITYFTPYLEKIEVKARVLLEEKPLTTEASKRFEEHIVEIVDRIGHGGFSMNIPLNVVLESLYRYSSGILSHAKAYSNECVIIDGNHIRDAIVYLDTRLILSSICIDVMKEVNYLR